jgi:hypothetical protein
MSTRPRMVRPSTKRMRVVRPLSTSSLAPTIRVTGSMDPIGGDPATMAHPTGTIRGALESTRATIMAGITGIAGTMVITDIMGTTDIMDTMVIMAGTMGVIMVDTTAVEVIMAATMEVEAITVVAGTMAGVTVEATGAATNR